MRYLTAFMLLLLIGCGGNLRTQGAPVRSPGVVEVSGQSLEIPPGVDPTLMQQLAAELELQLTQRRYSEAPTQHLTPYTEVDGNDMWVYWEYAVNGDYDQNGEVNVADITPIAIDYQASDADADWDHHRMADGDYNGEVNQADISRIAVNYADTFGEYILESAPGPAGPWSVVGHYNLEYGKFPTGGGLREFDVMVPDGATLVYQYIWTETPGGGGEGGDKMDLWTNGPKLRGVNIWQGVVMPKYYGDIQGPGPLGSPYNQADFDMMAAWGCNYVNISHAGLYSVTAPYVVNQDAVNNLDSVLAMIEAADMFAVITMRTGPGRSEMTFHRDGVGDWVDAADVIETMWTTQTELDAWAEMWRYIANRYKANPIVVGYDLICEPNSPLILHGLWEEVDQYYPAHAGDTDDINRYYPQWIAAIRAADPDTPIIAGVNNYSQPAWLPGMKLLSDNRVVYAVHQYAPDEYTHQYIDLFPTLPITYPGTVDSQPFNNALLESMLAPISTFTTVNSVPVVLNEWGLLRYEPGGHTYVDDMANIFETLGINSAIWDWTATFEAEHEDNTDDGFTYRYGANPNNHTSVVSDPLANSIKVYWGLNTIRPSNWASGPSPTAMLQATPLSGETPLSVSLDATGSTDDGSIEHYSWDLDGDGIFSEVSNFEDAYDEATTVNYLFETVGSIQPAVKVTDNDGLSSTASVTLTIQSNNGRLAQLNTINHWMYQIQELDAPGAVSALAATHYDMLVLEPTNTNDGQESFDAAAAVALLKASPDSRGGNKLVIAYIDIGEAEDYRTYWDAGWTAPADRDTPGTPDWLVTIDPDGWSGNYPVAFWRSEWEDIVINNADSLLNRAIDDGFQGIYMDWVEGYDDLKVDDAALAEVPPVHVADAMVEFIGKIRTAARLRDPDFLVIQQNAPYLIDHATSEAAWLAVIDGIAFEDTWFSGAGDGVWNDPGSGDTPNDGTGEYSTANRVIQSQRLLGLGLRVLTVDYCLPLPFKLAPPENFPQVYADSNSAGFIPLCTQVGLEKITTTPPPWY